MATDYIGYISLANDYLDCAIYLQKGRDTKELKLRFRSPILANLAHATELAIKGHLISLGVGEDEVVGLGHDLERAFQRLEALSPSLVSTAAGQVKDHWRDLLRSKRDEFRNKLNPFDIHDQEYLRDLGVLSNADIGDDLPTLKRDLKWLSDLHKSNGGAFRYFESRLVERPVVEEFDLDLFTVPVSIAIGTKSLIDQIK